VRLRHDQRNQPCQLRLVQKGTAVKSVRERYLTDATFRYIVDGMRAIISSAQLAPDEVREAAMLACIIEAERHPAQPLVLTNGEIEMLSDYLKRQVR
jgi:hypothetical protein